MLQVAEGAHVTLNGVVISGGYAGEGAGILNRGTLTLLSCEVKDSIADTRLLPSNCVDRRDAGKPIAGGGILNHGDLKMVNSVVSGNRAEGSGGQGEVGGQWCARGGGIANTGRMEDEGSTISGNSACSTGGVRP